MPFEGFSPLLEHSLLGFQKQAHLSILASGSKRAVTLHNILDI